MAKRTAAAEFLGKGCRCEGCIVGHLIRIGMIRSLNESTENDNQRRLPDFGSGLQEWGRGEG